MRLGTLAAAALLTLLGSTTIASCSSENPEEGRCSSGCTDGEWDSIFVDAANELHDEGWEITFTTIRTDRALYEAFVQRMVKIAGGSGSEDSAQPQSRPQAFEPYVPTTEYCGPGAVADGSYRVHGGDCINRACWDHDNCYGTFEQGFNENCVWSSSTQTCDGWFHSAYENCQAIGECGADCRAIAAFARGAEELCGNVIGWSAIVDCNDRAENCIDCTAFEVPDACAAFGAECGATQDGCGLPLDCGTCPDGQICSDFDGLPNQCGRPCIQFCECTLANPANIGAWSSPDCVENCETFDVYDEPSCEHDLSPVAPECVSLCSVFARNN